jgi:hypothetical protein
MSNYLRSMFSKIYRIINFPIYQQLETLENQISSLERNQRGTTSYSGKKIQKLGLDVTYRGDRFPSEFHFLNAKDFLYDSKDLRDWGPAKQAWYLTEYDLSERYKFMVAAMGYIRAGGASGATDYYEFGCFGANTFRMALTEAKKHGLDSMKFFAFDSFEGLPSTDQEGLPLAWGPGEMAMGEAEFWSAIKGHGLYLDQITTIKGFYADSLTKSLQQELVASGRKIALANIDCDLRISAEPIFDFIEPLLQEGSIIYLDEYFIGDGGSPVKGVGGAFHEYEKISSFSFLPFLNVGWWGKSFICY